mgnify:CR=1 FL=1
MSESTKSILQRLDAIEAATGAKLTELQRLRRLKEKEEQRLEQYERVKKNGLWAFKKPTGGGTPYNPFVHPNIPPGHRWNPETAQIEKIPPPPPVPTVVSKEPNDDDTEMRDTETAKKRSRDELDPSDEEDDPGEYNMTRNKGSRSNLKATGMSFQGRLQDWKDHPQGPMMGETGSSHRGRYTGLVRPKWPTVVRPYTKNTRRHVVGNRPTGILDNHYYAKDVIGSHTQSAFISPHATLGQRGAKSVVDSIPALKPGSHHWLFS